MTRLRDLLLTAWAVALTLSRTVRGLSVVRVCA